MWWYVMVATPKISKQLPLGDATFCSPGQNVLSMEMSIEAVSCGFEARAGSHSRELCPQLYCSGQHLSGSNNAVPFA